MTNNVTFDKQEQLDKIVANLIQGERVIAVYDAVGAGTGFIGLTDKRIVIQDNSFAGKKIALTSIPYNRVNSVSFLSDKSMFGKFASSSTIAVTTSSNLHEVQFRGDDKAKHAHDVILWGMMQ